MNARPIMKSTTSKAWLLLSLCLAAGCKQLDDDKTPKVPTNLSAERKEPIIRSTWNGLTTDYDFQQSLHDDAKGWIDQKAETLTNVPTMPDSGKYFKDVNALPQPMRFRVAAVQGSQKSDWTDWVTNSPSR